MKPEFGGHTGDVRAEADVYVRRPLNEYSGLDEVFQFSFIEPEVSQASRDVIVSARYMLTRDARNQVPGVDKTEYSTRLTHVEKVPDEILERAQAMIDNMVILNEDED